MVSGHETPTMRSELTEEEERCHRIWDRLCLRSRGQAIEDDDVAPVSSIYSGEDLADVTVAAIIRDTRNAQKRSVSVWGESEIEKHIDNGDPFARGFRGKRDDVCAELLHCVVWDKILEFIMDNKLPESHALIDKMLKLSSQVTEMKREKVNEYYNILREEAPRNDAKEKGDKTKEGEKGKGKKTIRRT